MVRDADAVVVPDAVVAADNGSHGPTAMTIETPRVTRLPRAAGATA
jgi:hypothetical protein